MNSTVHPQATREILDYIESMPPFYRGMCTKLRDLILNADPDIVEDWKWGPHYHCNGMVCGFSAFKKHVKLTFFNGSAMSDSLGLFNHCVDNEFSRSIKFTDPGELDPASLTAYIKESVVVNKNGFRREVKNKSVEVPADLEKALSHNKPARLFFESLTYGYRKEYVEWITSAKREETRNERIAKTVALCAAERRLNDKYK